MKERRNGIASIFQIGRETYNLSFHKDAPYENLIETFLRNTVQGIPTQNETLYLHKPQPPAVQINIRAVPTEVENAEIEQRIKQYGCGTVRNIKLIYHRGTDIHNGYRQITISDYIPGKLPPFLYLGRAPCI